LKAIFEKKVANRTFIEVDGIAPNARLLYLLRKTPCIGCAEVKKSVDAQVFVPMSESDGSEVGLVGFCRMHIGGFIRTLDKGRRTSHRGALRVGRSAIPLLGFGAAPPETGPQALRQFKCVWCKNVRARATQADGFLPINRRLDDFPLREREQITLMGMCFQDMMRL